MKISIDGRLFDMPTEDSGSSVPMIVSRRIKREYGYVPGKDSLDLRDPDHACAYMFMVLYRENPKMPLERLVEQVDQVKVLDFVNDDGSPLTDAQVADEKDPTKPPSGGENDSGQEPVEAGN